MLKQIDLFFKKIKMKKHELLADLVINYVNVLKYKKISNIELKNKLLQLKSDGFEHDQDSISIIRELSYRFTGLYAFKSQIVGAILLMNGNIVEMKTGEGKTLATVFALILNYLKNKKGHIVTANDYLVARDYAFSKKLFSFIGISSSFIEKEITQEDREHAYLSDVLYATSKTLVFDYLANNKLYDEKHLLNDEKDFLIVDEIDFVFIDEATVPIVLSGLTDNNKELYTVLQKIQENFVGANKDDKNEKSESPHFYYDKKTIEISERGLVELSRNLVNFGFRKKGFCFFDSGDDLMFLRAMEMTIKANKFIDKGVHYLVLDKQIALINQQTGRVQKNNRFMGGMHQALEAKENLEIHQDAITLAKTTLQNFFKKYKIRSGTTGTAATECIEFREFYSLDVFELKTNKPLIRIDMNDALFFDKKSLESSLAKKILNNIKNRKPTLIGVQSVMESSRIAMILKKENIEFNVLDANNNKKEAEIISLAGCPSAVTIATNIAGRGTDIMLGGNKEFVIKILMQKGKTKENALKEWKEMNETVINVGGLSVIGIGRGSARRFDNQLIGRAGRQGDPGDSRFYISLDDDIFRNIPLNHIKNMWEKDLSVSIYSQTMTKQISSIQKMYENNSFNIRKNTLKFDNIDTEQREIYYKWRLKVLKTKSIADLTDRYMYDVVCNVVDVNYDDYGELTKKIKRLFNFDIIKNKNQNKDDLIKYLFRVLKNNINKRLDEISECDLIEIKKGFLLKVMDNNWAENISELEYLRQDTGLRVYAQKNPLDEYQKEALILFNSLLMNVKNGYMEVINNFSPMDLLKTDSDDEYKTEKTNVNIDKNKMNDTRSINEPMLGVGI